MSDERVVAATGTGATLHLRPQGTGMAVLFAAIAVMLALRAVLAPALDRPVWNVWTLSFGALTALVAAVGVLRRAVIGTADGRLLLRGLVRTTTVHRSEIADVRVRRGNWYRGHPVAITTRDGRELRLAPASSVTEAADQQRRLDEWLHVAR